MIGDDSSSRPFLLEHQESFSSLLPARRGALQLGGLTFGVSLLIYVLCLPSAITGGWAGEWTAAAALPGISHAPGYPAWTLVACLANEVLPFGTAPWRVALVSAIATALSCGLLTLWLRQQDVGRRASIAGGLLLGFGGAVWSGAVVPGPHSFQLMLTLALFVTAYQGVATRRSRWFVTAALLLGVGLSNHPSFIVSGVIVALALAPRRTPGLTGRRIAVRVVAAFFVGLLPLLYLPIRASDAPYLNRGALESSADLPRFIAGGIGHRLPRTAEANESGRIAIVPSSSLEQPPGVGARVASALFGEHAGVLLVLALCGMALVLVRNRGDGLVLIAFTAATPLYTLVTLDSEHAPGAPLGALLGMAFAGIAALAAFALDAMLQRFGNGPTLPARSLTALVACLPLVFIALHYETGDRSHSRLAEDHARSILESIPRNAVLFTAGDYRTSPLIYVHGVLRERPDVVLGDPYGVVDWERLPSLVGHRRFGEETTAPEIVAALLSNDQHAVLTTTRFALPPGYEWSHYGFVYLAEPEQRISPVGESTLSFTFSYLPTTPPEDPEDLERPGAPLDFYDRLVAADYYEALARHYNRLGKRSSGAAAARLATLLHRN